ncbi:hypothetical protein NLX83_39730 [Allokutzneria sp. A3M-2-11 16]|uniref:hypothetical protein n=1 Tax=Allokutzneria sp. A3M-2-11 16 TaxID=2962043 RepID=UPI0020B81CA2|nr:hypothetical protein [Allokutzneria sp. A3M-2-11 16]MCP3805416.1 hypothetical protein [Allokutzneria sp. A3M-2-11 16]
MIEFERHSLPLAELGIEVWEWLRAVADHAEHHGLLGDLAMVGGVDPVIQLPTWRMPGAPGQAVVVLAWLRSLSHCLPVQVDAFEDFAAVSFLGRLYGGQVAEVCVVYDGAGWRELCVAAADGGSVSRDAVVHILARALGVSA